MDLKAAGVLVCALALIAVAPSVGFAADKWVAITVDGFEDEIAPLANLRGAAGLDTAVVALSVVDEYGDDDGTATALELRSYLCDLALDEEDFVILVGSVDSSLPDTAVSVLGSMIDEYDDFFVDCDSDAKPEASIGRLPAVSSSDVSAMVGKIVDHEGIDWEATDADNDWAIICDDTNLPKREPHGDRLEKSLLELTEELPSDCFWGSYGATSLAFRTSMQLAGERQEYLADRANGDLAAIWALGTRAAPQSVVAFIDENTQVLDWNDWNNDHYPVLFGMSCDLGREKDPTGGADIPADMMRRPSEGLLAVVGPSEDTTLPMSFLTTKTMMQELLKFGPFSPSARTLGKTIRDWKESTLDVYWADEETVVSMRLLGDPATTFRVRADFLTDATLQASQSRSYEGQYLRLYVSSVTDHSFSDVDLSRYEYTWTTDNGLFAYSGGWYPYAVTSEPEILMLCPEGDCTVNEIANISVAIEEDGFECSSHTVEIEHAFDSVPGGGCPVVQTKPAGQWVDKNSILGERIYAASVESNDELHLAPPVAASPMYEVKIRESDAVNFTLLDHVQIRYMDRPIGTETFVSQSGKAYEATAVSPDSVWLALGVDVTSDLASADTLNLTVAEGDTVYAVFADSFATVAAGLPVIRSRTKPHLYQADLGGQGEWGLRMLPEYGVGPMEPLLPRQEWYPCFADSPVVVRGDGIPDTVAWAIGEVHELDEIKLLDNATVWTGGNTYPVLNAIHSDSGLVTTLVNSDDSNYCRIDYGQDIKLSFTYPFVPAGFQREIVLHINGTYEHISAPFNSDPNAGQGLPWGFHAVYPNPSNGRTQVQFLAEGVGRCRLAVYDVSGRCIRTIIDEPAPPAGLVRTTWNGMDDRGNRVSSGVYFLRLQEGKLREAEKVVVLR